jgi:hypothetical protein
MIINNEAVEEEEEEARVTGTRMRSTHNTQLRYTQIASAPPKFT